MPLIVSNLLLILTLSLLTFIGYLFTETNKKQKRALLKLSNKDEVTGLKNKKLLHDKLSEKVEKHLRIKQNSSLLIIELDNFQQLINLYTFKNGDRILKKTAGIIKNKLRVTDKLYHFEGNKFAIVAFNTSLKGAGHLAETLREHIQKTDSVKNINITVSIGVAQISILDDADSWLNRADASLFGAQNTGGNSTFLAIPEERSLNYELEPFTNEDNQENNAEKDPKIVSLKTFRKKKLINSESTF